MWLWITLLAVVGGAVWVVRRLGKRGRGGMERDVAELQAAEEEVRDLDAFATPEDADERLPDWGPGAG